MAQRRLIQAIFDNEKLLKACQASSEQDDTSLENVTGSDTEAGVVEVTPRSEQFQNAAKQLTAGKLYKNFTLCEWLNVFSSRGFDRVDQTGETWTNDHVFNALTGIWSAYYGQGGSVATW